MTSKSTLSRGGPRSGTQKTGATGVSHAVIPATTTRRVKVVPPQPDTGGREHNRHHDPMTYFGVGVC